ncbi:MAG: EamA family transporter, partial [Sphaerochaetaceae bacterium]|nr:EamA family transporter [Sphaerochaetaceae bacterium]
LLVAGLIHTALAYVLYFGSTKKVSAQSAAIISYIDPIVAVLISALVLNEGMSALAIFGVILVISSALISELGKQQT